MKEQLYINNKDAWTTWGVRMGDGMLDALDAPSAMKSYIENENRTAHGKQVITQNAKVDSRDVTLAFTITGTSPSDYHSKKKAFVAELQAGAFTLKVPSLGSEVYHFVYTGKSISYGLSIDRCFGHLSMKATEPDPTNRE